VLFKGKSKSLPQLMAEAEAASRNGRAADAEALLRQVLQTEENEENRRILGQAALELGAICDRRNAPGEALQHYGKARYLGAALTPGAWALLAENYAEQQSRTDYALGAYLAYLQERAPEAISAKVSAALEAACRVDENHVSDDRKRAAALSKRVISANGALEWPYYYLAISYLQDGDLPAAMVNLMRAQKRNPNRAMTYYWMGACHLRQSGGAPGAAIEWLSKFLAFRADNKEIAELQMGAALELGKRLAGREEAIPFLAFAIGKDPASTEARELGARAALNGGRYADAEAHARAAIELGGRRPATIELLLEALYRQGKFAEVVSQWEQGPLPEIGVEATFHAASSYSRLGRFAEALQWLETSPREPRRDYYSGCALANLGRLEEAKSRFQELAANAGEYGARAWVQLGAIFLRAGDIGAAGDAYDRALALDPQSAGAFYGMGSLAYRMGEMEVAADCFAKVLQRRPEDIPAQLAMGVVHESRRETAQAIACYEAVAQPLDVRVRLGVVYCRAGRYDKAAEALEPLYGSGFEKDAVLYYLGMSYAGLQRYEEAVEIWNKLAARRPEDRELEKGLAELYLAQALQRWESREAESLLDQALVHDPGNARCQYFRALYDWKRGQLSPAAARLRELGEHSEDPRVLYHAGLCLALSGAQDEAARYFERAAVHRDNDYGLYAAWAIANQHIRQGQYAEAEAILAGFA
jgi:tetratricopeptide (TPR) repeat protein